MATVTKPQITAAEFLAMDLGPGLHELVRGEVVKMTPPDYRHGHVCLNIGRLLAGYGATTRLGHAATNDARVDIDRQTVRGADVAFYSEARWPRDRIGAEAPPVPPDLVVEVVSANDRPGKVQEKVADYLNAGVAMVWVADPKRRTLAIYRADDATPTVLGDADDLRDPPGLPGFACRVAEFFD